MNGEDVIKESMKGFTEAFFSIPQPIQSVSRLFARCGRCTYQGSRSEFYKPLPGQTPGFDDSCPHCRSTNVDVMDPAFSGVNEIDRNS